MDPLSDVIGRQQYRGRCVSLPSLSTRSRESAGLFADAYTHTQTHTCTRKPRSRMHRKWHTVPQYRGWKPSMNNFYATCTLGASCWWIKEGIYKCSVLQVSDTREGGWLDFYRVKLMIIYASTCNIKCNYECYLFEQFQDNEDRRNYYLTLGVNLLFI